mmetsp:Transcript_11749/g.27596  ORF Transcript_11749/g.27596 Transcript_11749/m.27596 type:complete len:213 (+) Transcript_11749:91-729(+)
MISGSVSSSNDSRTATALTTPKISNAMTPSEPSSFWSISRAPAPLTFERIRWRTWLAHSSLSIFFGLRDTSSQDASSCATLLFCSRSLSASSIRSTVSLINKPVRERNNLVLPSMRTIGNVTEPVSNARWHKLKTGLQLNRATLDGSGDLVRISQPTDFARLYSHVEPEGMKVTFHLILHELSSRTSHLTNLVAYPSNSFWQSPCLFFIVSA